ncbi:hypothetical protein AT238_05125 [Bartonella henselae]|nr:hypothetical protein AT239_03575 [Bartonella henselae]OLL54767.1 hypothetical protein AT238_05125 [Bartonella henselae]OLL54918.1 hypothetical protein AT240_07725 [Bartonella henselae]
MKKLHWNRDNPRKGTEGSDGDEGSFWNFSSENLFTRSHLFKAYEAYCGGEKAPFTQTPEPLLLRSILFEFLFLEHRF